MPTVLLVRHAQASFGGADYDVLSESGHRQVEAVRSELARRGVRPDVVVSGRLRRQLDTAAPFARAAGTEVVVDPRWEEYQTGEVLSAYSDTGAREDRPPGTDAPAISSREFQVLLDAALLRWIAAGHESAAGESWPAFRARVEAALAEVTGGLDSGQTAVVSSSGGVIAAVCVAVLGLPAEALVTFNRVMVNTGVTKLVHGRRGTTLVTFNEHGHLEQRDGALVTYR